MTPSALATRINELMASLLQAGCAIDIGHHVVSQGRSGVAIVSWRLSVIVAGEFPRERFACLDEYIYFLENRQYSGVLSDGAILQISYQIRRNKIVWHRLCYYPCPLHFVPEEIGEEPLVDLILNLDYGSLKDRLRMRSAVRFDFDPDNARFNHPASHVTINETCCRIPVRASLDLRNFVHFVFMNFYPDHWNSVAALHALPSRAASQPYLYRGATKSTSSLA